jgi:hypothetical protein
LASAIGLEGFEYYLLWLSHIFQLTIYIWLESQQPEHHMYCNLHELKRYITLIYFPNNSSHCHYRPLNEVVTNVSTSHGIYNNAISSMPKAQIPKVLSIIPTSHHSLHLLKKTIHNKDTKKMQVKKDETIAHACKTDSVVDKSIRL